MKDFPDSYYLLTILRRVCAARDWRLFSFPELGITEADAVRQMDAQLREWQNDEGHAEIDDALIERAAKRVYCCALHRAIGLEHTAVQERALTELWNWITPIVRRYVRDRGQAAACANGVLLIIWQRCGTIRDPGSLLAFSAQTAAYAALRMLREDERYEQILDATEGEEDPDMEQHPRRNIADEHAWLSWSTSAGDSVHERIERDSIQAAFEKLIRRCLRSLAQQEVFIDLVLRDLTVTEVAARLGITPINVAVLKHRAKNALGRCKALLEALGRRDTVQSEVRHDSC